MAVVTVPAEPPSGMAALAPLRPGNQQGAEHSSWRARLHPCYWCCCDGELAQSSPQGISIIPLLQELAGQAEFSCVMVLCRLLGSSWHGMLAGQTALGATGAASTALEQSMK